MPTVYEHVRDGQVDDRVEPTPGDYEDTRIGLAVLEAEDAAERGEPLTEYWRIAGEPAAAVGPAGEAPTPDPAEPAAEPDIDVPAQPANPEE